MALPLCLDRLVNVAVALVLSTTAIVLFGESCAAGCDSMAAKYTATAHARLPFTCSTAQAAWL